MAEKRKRGREDDEYQLFGVNQLKYFVNQQLVDKNDETKMRAIHKKTLQMLFSGANANSGSKQKLEENMDAVDGAAALDTIDDKLAETQACSFCPRNVNPSKGFCKNCYLIVCENCRTNCLECASNGVMAHLCFNCVKFFGCSISDDPFCEDCKRYN